MKDMEEYKESLQPQDDKREKAKVTLLAVIAACLVTIVIQNFFPTEREVNGNMWLDGGYVSVDGGYVNVGGEVSVGNISEIPALATSNTNAFASPLSLNGFGSTDVNLVGINGYSVPSDGIPVKLVGVEIHRISSSPSEENCVPIDIRMVRGYDVDYSSYGVPVKVK